MPIITTSRSTSHVQAETQVVTQQEPRSTRSDRKIMTAPYNINSICHPCPWRCWHCPELNHCSDIITALKQGSSVSSVPQPSPLHRTSTRRSECPVGLYLLALGRTHALKREGHSRMRRWVRRHGGPKSSGDQRRKHQSDDHRPAVNANQTQTAKQKLKLPLIQPPCGSFE